MSHATRARPDRRRLLRLALWGAVAACLGPGGRAVAQTALPSPAAQWPRAAFPLRLSAGERHLVDATGQPFFLHGDSAWSLIAQLTREDASRFLQDRQQRGFNTLLVNLLEHQFSTRAPANVYGQQPFVTPGDFTTPNEAYFAHADRVLREAAERGMLVLLAPAYLGYDGGDQGWYREMLANGPDKLRAYGRYLGRRYSGFRNILWVHGGDYNPPNKDLVRAIADGVRESDTLALHTAHCAPETAAIEYWKGEPWLQVNNAYTYRQVFPSAIRQYMRSERLPYFLLESAYENEHGAAEQRLRMQAYQALLSGAAGHVYGNNPIWHFDGPGLFPAPLSWQASLASRGAQSMSHLRALFETLPWWKLVPDTRQALLASGQGPERERAVAAATEDGALAVVYLPTPRALRIDLRRLRGPNTLARWYDPAEGRYLEGDGDTLPATKVRAIRPPERDGGPQGDWVLVLTSAG